MSHSLFAAAQYNPNGPFPEIGKPCPDFILRNFEDYPKKQASLKDFLGKWLIIDFWSKNCSSCMERFPEMNVLEKKFNDKVQIILVGLEDKEGVIRPMYAKFRKREHLNIPVAFDSLAYRRFDISSVPHYIILDDKGIVRAFTNLIQEKDIRDFLDGKQPVLNETYTRTHEAINTLKFFNRDIPYLIKDNGGTDSDFTYRAVFSKWSKNAGFLNSNISRELQQTPNRIDFINTDLVRLYLLAYIDNAGRIAPTDPEYGKLYPLPLLETKDSLFFKFSKVHENDYCFSLTMPPIHNQQKNLEQFKSAMQRELKNYFGYETKMEIRNMPYLRLVVTSEKSQQKLMTKGGAPAITGMNWANISYINQPVSKLIDAFAYMNPYGLAFIDETGIKANIDIKIDAIFTDLNDIKRALRENGLDLVKSEREMKVLVIRDPKPEVSTNQDNNLKGRF